ncbi:50S ribosomal protein L17 [Candidatus Kaiserbacteria bacterium]|nr:50S ribosomal protein L17 [Candidatus Kaiserbacteria bacterium]
MRHHDRNRKLGREKRQRVALLRNLARSLILKEGITTTEAKAKALRPYVERLVTSAKRNSLAGTRAAAKRLGSEETNKKLKELAERYGKRAGGYTRIVRLGRIGKRVGDMSRIEFVK